MEPVLLLLVVIVAILVFTYTNGFHDAANSIATVVGTRVLTPRQAVLLGAVTNFLGALSGVAVARTIGAGLVEANSVTIETILCAMLAGITWDVLTWYYGLPSSSTHALVGGLLGAALASAHNQWSVIKWTTGLYPKVVVPMFTSPLIGFAGGMLVMGLMYVIIRRMRPRTVDRVFGKLQLLSASYMGWAHGFNDGQKEMGLIALACYVATTQSNLEHLPSWLGFLRSPKFVVQPWAQWACGLAMATGTYIGGWRIIQTLGRKMVRLRPVQGFAAETTGATILAVTGAMGISVSTTHVITTAIMGVGCAKRFSALNWTLAERIVWAWIFTVPASGAMGYGLICLARLLGWVK
jgi:PiT family inorganic phosphate transporter